MVREQPDQLASRGAEPALRHEAEVGLRDQADPDPGRDRIGREPELVNDERTVDLQRLHAGRTGQLELVSLRRLTAQDEAVA